jgi:hypothetical protein
VTIFLYRESVANCKKRGAHINAEKFLRSCTIGSFSRRAQLHEGENE